MNPTRSLPVLLPALLLATACARPEVAAVAERRVPVAVALSLPASVSDRTRLEGLYADAIRRQLAGRVAVLPAEAPVPVGTPRLLVTLSVEASPSGAAAAQGGAFGDTLGTGYSLGAGKSLLPAMGDGILTGLVLGAISAGGASAREGYHARRLGYRPNHIACEIAFQDASGPVRVLGRTDAWAVVKRMQPLQAGPAPDPEAIRREEARALAEEVAARMEKHGWSAPRGAAPAS
ncbi:MAG: hypothetical protein U0P81_00195 [Holophagaceae bacterium]